MKVAIMSRFSPHCVAVLAALACGSQIATAQSRTAAAPPRIIVMGDSIGEGVQAADANWRTQVNTYIARVANQMGITLSQPLIETSPRAIIFSVEGRQRIFPNVSADNMSVSGADTTSANEEAADAQISTETDLVLFPRIGTQLANAVANPTRFMFYWLGNNDVLGAVLAFDQLDASQVTPIAQVDASVEHAFATLQAAGKKWICATIPDVQRIGFLFDRDALIRFAGTDYGLPAGSKTSIVAALLLRMGLEDPSLLQDPNWVLDAQEIAKLQQDVINLNNVIKAKAAKYNVPVVDIYAEFERLSANPPVYGGVPLYAYFNGGLLSLDAVHPSNIAHALIANQFIRVMNASLGSSIPEITDAELNGITLNDPHVDLDGDGVVRGRPFAGLLETLGPRLGISGDDEAVRGTRRPAPLSASAFLAEYNRVRGLKDTPVTRDAVLEALRYVFGLSGRKAGRR
jgi:phospholipase/lecithinase/hemolysin